MARFTTRTDLDSLFATAIDSKGRTYRIMNAAGGNPVVSLRLEPWSVGPTASKYRGHWITENDDDFPALQKANREKMELSIAAISPEEKARVRRLFTADEI